MKKSKSKAGRKPLPAGLKKVMIRFYSESDNVTNHGGIESAIEKCKQLLLKKK